MLLQGLRNSPLPPGGGGLGWGGSSREGEKTFSECIHIFLTGFMGTGKSSVGKVLAARTGRRFVDLDEAVVAAAGMSITDIFASRGEPAFRALESEALQKVSLESGLVVATGGGAVIDPENRRVMRATGCIVNLTASADAIGARLGDDDTRPLLQEDNPHSKIVSMLAQRESFYADADVRIETGGRSVADIVDEILVWLKNRCT